MKSDGTDRVLADDGGPIVNRRDPVYSPDMTQIAFTNGAALFRMNANGTGTTAVVGRMRTTTQTGRRRALSSHTTTEPPTTATSVGSTWCSHPAPVTRT